MKRAIVRGILVCGSFAIVSSARGQAPTLLPGWPVTSLSGAVFTTPSAGDITGDGLPEVFVWDFINPPTLHALEHTGAMAGGWSTTPPLLDNYSQRFLVGDIDGDGNNEVVYRLYNMVHALDGAGVAKPGWPVTCSPYKGPFVDAQPLLADLDSDGDKEVVMPGPSWSGPMGLLGPVRVYAFQGDGSPVAGWPVEVEESPLYPAGIVWGTMAAGDLDFDGRDEVVVPVFFPGSFSGGPATQPGPTYLFQGDGTLRPGWPVVAPTVSVGIGNAMIADLDGDDRCEIIGSSGVNLRAYRDDGSVRFTSPTCYGGIPFAIGDLNQDGSLETIMLCPDQILIFDANGNFLVGSDAYMQEAAYYTVSVADVNNDGDLEIAIMGNNAPYRLFVLDRFLNPLPGFPIEHPGLYSAYPYSLPIIDMDGDGDLEIVCVNYNKVYAYSFPDPGTAEDVAWSQRGNDPGNSNNFQRSLVDRYLRGDADGNGTITVGDVVAALTHLFMGTSTNCPAALDSNRDRLLNIADPVYLLAYLFLSAAPPPLPFPECREFPAVRALACERAACP